MKHIKLTLLTFIATLFAYTSCTNSPPIVNSEGEVSSEQYNNWDTEIPYESLKPFRATYETNTSTPLERKRNRESAIEEVFVQFIAFATKQIDQTKNEILTFSFVDNKETGEFYILDATIFHTESILKDESGEFFIGLAYPDELIQRITEPSTRTPKEYTIECIGGESNGKTKTVKRTLKGAKEAIKFIDDCLEGGGCAQACQGTVNIY